MACRHRGAVLVALCGLALTGAVLVAPSEAAPRASTVRLVVEPAVPVVGERPLVSGRAPGPAGRTVRLQVRRDDGNWRTIDRRSTRADRTFAFRLDPLSGAGRRLRVTADRTGDQGAWRSAAVLVRGRDRTVEVRLPANAEEGSAVLATV